MTRERYGADFAALFMGQTDTISTAASIVDPSLSLFPNLGPFQGFTTERETERGEISASYNLHKSLSSSHSLQSVLSLP